MVALSRLPLSIIRSAELTSIRAVFIFSAVGVAVDLLCCVLGDIFLYIEGGLGSPETEAKWNIAIPTLCSTCTSHI